MKHLAISFLAAAVAFGAGSVQQQPSQIGQNYLITLTWTGDPGNGSVPATPIQSSLAAGFQGYRVISVETQPLTPAPASGYSLTLTDTSGTDLLAGSAASLSATSSQSFAAAPAAPPIFGSITLNITGQNVPSASGVVYVYFAPVTQALGLVPPQPSFPPQGADLIYASPCGTFGSPGFRVLCGDDLPPIALGSTGNGGVIGTTGVGNGGTGVTQAQGVGDPRVQLAAGSATPGDCPQYDANGGLIDSGGLCFSPPGGSPGQYLQIQPNSSTLTYRWNSLPIAQASDYNFPPQTPGGTLTSGTPATITLSPPPLGVYGADSSHLLYISGGNGTAESTLITGGTCSRTSAGSCTITITPANSHSAAWTIQSATGGAAEAQSALGMAGGTIVYPAGTTQIYGQFTGQVTTPLRITGPGHGAAVLSFNQTSGTLFNLMSRYVGIDNLHIVSASGTPQNVTGVVLSSSTAFVHDMEMLDLYIFVESVSVANIISIEHNLMLSPYTSGIGVYFPESSSEGNAVINGNVITGTAGAFLAGVYINSGSDGVSGMYITNNNIFQSSYGVYASGTAGQILSANNTYQSTQAGGLVFAPTSGSYQRSIASVNDNIENGAGYGIYIAGSGTVDAINIANCMVNLQALSGIWLTNGNNTSISNCTVAENSRGNSGAYSGLQVYSGVSKVSVIGGVYGPAEGTPADANTQACGISISAGSSDDLSIVGAFIPVNVTGAICDSSTGIHKVIEKNLGVDTATPPTLASATSLALPTSDQPLYYITGTTTVTTISGGWIHRTIDIVKTDTGTLTVGGGGNIPASHALTQNTRVTLMFDGTNWY